MTMNYHIVIGQKISKQRQKQISLAINEIFNLTDRVYNNWNPSSEISQINQASKILPISISEQLKDLLVRCEECYQITRYRFDPTIGSIFNSWKKALMKNHVPKELVDEAVGWQKIILHELSLQKKHSKCQFDLCGISKGYTIDLISKKLSNLGFKNFFVEWGGEVFARGLHPEKRKWSILINSIPKNANPLVLLKDQAIATSGSSMLYNWEANGKSYFHIFDPKSKRPLERSSISTVTVIADKCYLADAVATAAMTFTDLNELRKWGHTIIKSCPKVSSIIIKFDDNTIERIPNERHNLF